MGNAQLKADAEEAENNSSIDISRRLTPEQFIKHSSGECIEGSLLALPWEIYYNTVSLLKSVSASFNYIGQIPEELSLHVPHLRYLNLSHNQIASLPSTFHLLFHLRVLDLSYNRLRKVPDVIFHLPKLQSLNLAGNQLLDLPQTISMLRTLEKLNVGYNNLRALPGTITYCPKLRVLVISGNDMIHPPQLVCDEGCDAMMAYLKQQMPAPQARLVAMTSVFTRVRGQAVLASVSNPESASVEYRQAQSQARTNKRKCPLMPPAEATSLNSEKLKDTLLGLFYGAAVADAFALKTEGLTIEESRFHYDWKRIKLGDRIDDIVRLQYPPADWSCNGDLMVLTLDSIMRWGGVVDELEFASQLDQWRIHGLMEMDPMPGHVLSALMKIVICCESYSVTPHTVAETIYRHVWEEKLRGSTSKVNTSDNSCLPPALVMGIPSFYMESEVIMNAERICQATHADAVANSCCIFVALLVATILRGEAGDGKDICEIVTQIKEKVSSRMTYNDAARGRFLSSFQEINCPPSEGLPSQRVSSDDVTSSLQAILKGLRGKDGVVDFRMEITNLVMEGQNGVCASACLLGGLLGAMGGYSSLPQEWLSQLPETNLQSMNGKLNALLDLFGLP